MVSGDRRGPKTLGQRRPAAPAASAKKKRSLEKEILIVGGSAGAGAAIGAVAGGKKGAGIGAIAGGGGGTGVVLATKGNEIHFGPETQLNFILANSVKL